MKRFFIINLIQLLLITIKDVDHIIKINKIEILNSFRRNYYKFIFFDQIKFITIVYDNLYNFYVIKKHKCNSNRFLKNDFSILILITH